jgi:hypothetical protein
MDLTVIIPTRDRNDSVVECVLALDHNNVDIVVVDDGSEQPVAVLSTNARVIRHDRHRGRAAAINTGLKAALHDTVLIVEDDIYAAPDMVVRLVDEFAIQNNPRLCLAARVIWDPDVPPTLTMTWMEAAKKFRPPLLLGKQFVLGHGGYDENFTGRAEDVELQVRLEQHGFELRTIETAVGFQHNSVRIRNLIEQEFRDGVSAVFIHSKFPDFTSEIDDRDALVRNENQKPEAEAAVEEIALLEQSGSNILPAGASELYAQVCRHYFLHGVCEGLKDIGGMKRRRPSSMTIAIHKQASHLESIGEFDEARRLFQLVRQRPDEEYWDSAEYHLGCIETELGNPAAAHSHFMECLRRNPGHNKARRILNQPVLYREVDPNVFEIIEPAAARRILFVVFGGLSNIVNAFPVVAALREKFHCETVWLTSQEYVSLARASFADAVCEAGPPGIIPWDWIHSEGFTDVFFAEPEANQEEWQETGLHAIDFMARKCGVTLETHRAWLEPGADALFEAEEFLRQHELSRGAFVTACHGSEEGRHWPNSNLMKLGQQVDVPMVVFGGKTTSVIPGTIPCIDKPFQVIAAIIRWSCFYLGPDSGISWLATTTNTPMAVIADPHRPNPSNIGFRDALSGEKDDIREWDIYAGLQAVLAHVASKLPVEAAPER